MPSPRYTFGPFVLDPTERRLWKSGAPIDLAPTAFALLVALVRREGRLATREELLEEVWPDSVVEENALSVYVSKLRAALGETAQAPRTIETVPRIGYRLALPVAQTPNFQSPPGSDVVTPTPSLPRARHRRTRSVAMALLVGTLLVAGGFSIQALRGERVKETTINVLAVLPLSILGEGGDPDLGLAVTDALITQLGVLDRPIVRPTHAIASFAGTEPVAAGRALRADAVLDGRIQYDGGRLRVTLQLLQTRDGRSLWSGAFSVDGTDRLALQDALAEEVVRALARRLSPEEEGRVARRLPHEPVALEAYLRGRHAASRRTGADLRRALAAFRDAVAAEPTFAPAYAEMAQVYGLLVWYDGVPPHEAYPRSRAAAEVARQIDPTLAEALLALGAAAWLYDGDTERAERAFREAVAQAPHLAAANHQLGEFLGLTGRLSEGVGYLERARALDPLSPVIAVDAGTAYLFNGQPREAIRRYRAVLDLEPGFALARVFLSIALAATGDAAGAVQEAERAVADGGRAPLWLSVLAGAYAAAGLSDQARATLAEAEAAGENTFFSPVALGIALDGLGDYDAAREAFERADQVRDPMRIYIPRHPLLNSSGRERAGS